MTKFRKFLNKIMGYEYLINIRTQHIHKLNNIKSTCSVQFIKGHNKWYITSHQYERLITRHTEMHKCIHCFKET